MSENTALSFGQRVKVAFVWFLLGGAVLAIITHIVGFADDISIDSSSAYQPWESQPQGAPMAARRD